MDWSIQAFALRPGPAIGECIVDMGLGFFKPLGFVHLPDEVAGDADDVFRIVKGIVFVDDGAFVVRVNHFVSLLFFDHGC